MNEDYRAAEAVAALQQVDLDRIEYKSSIDSPALSVDGRDVTTLFSVDCVDSVGDITMPSAFEGAMQGKAENVPHLFMHDLMSPAIGLIRKFEQVARSDLPPDVQFEHPKATGGMACISTFLQTPRADEVFQGIKAGVPYGASFGYSVKQHAPHPHLKRADGRPVRVLNKVWLYEVSTCLPNHAANAATRTQLNKMYALFEEIKAGWRHGTHVDIERMNSMVAWLIDMGATNAQLRDVAPPADAPGRTSAVDSLIADIESIYEVTNERIRSATEVGHAALARRVERTA